MAVLQSSGGRLVNFPFVISFPSDATYADLYKRLLALLQRYLKSNTPPLAAEEAPIPPTPDAAPEEDDDETSSLLG